MTWNHGRMPMLSLRIDDHRMWDVFILTLSINRTAICHVANYSQSTTSTTPETYIHFLSLHFLSFTMSDSQYTDRRTAARSYRPSGYVSVFITISPYTFTSATL